MSRSKDTAAIVTYGDHEVITPENKLRGAVSKETSEGNEDPVARAEKALADLSSEFASWMDSECESSRSGSPRPGQGFLEAQQRCTFPRGSRHQRRSRNVRLSGGGVRG